MDPDLPLEDKGEVVADVTDLKELLTLVDMVVFEVLTAQINNLRLLLINR